MTGLVNELLSIQISATIPGTEGTAGLEIYVDDLPSGSSFNRGRREGERWIFTPQEFGQVELELPEGFSGRLNVEITAIAAGASRQRNLVIDVQSVTTPIATTGMPATTTPDDGGEDQCYNPPPIFLGITSGKPLYKY